MKAIIPIFAAAALAAASCTVRTDASAAGTATLLVGSYSEPGDSALVVYAFDLSDTTAHEQYRLPVANASYAAIAHDGKVYAVCESDEAASAISALVPDSLTGRLSVAGTLPVGSASPCYVAVSPDGRHAVTADYSGGTVSVFALDCAGVPAGLCRRIRFEGNGTDSIRQEQAHPHCIAFTPDNRHMLVDDLGLDCIHVFNLGGECLTGSDTPAADIAIRSGSGPRHITFSNDGTKAYLINELSDEVTVLNYSDGKLDPVQYIAADTVGARGAADIHLSPDGKHLYASLRLKNDGIATFDVNGDGSLTYRSHTPTAAHPRNFTISPDGRLMLVACRDGNEVMIFAVDPADGSLKDTGKRITQSKPVFVRFYTFPQ